MLLFCKKIQENCKNECIIIHKNLDQSRAIVRYEANNVTNRSIDEVAVKRLDLNCVEK